MEPIKSFQGNGLAGSVELHIFPTFVEHIHKNYRISVPLDQIDSVQYSNRSDGPYSTVTFGGIEFGCENRHEVYIALLTAIAALHK